MSKLSLNISLKNKTDNSLTKYSVEGILIDNKIIYYLENKKNEILLETEGFIYTRKDSESSMKFNFNKKSLLEIEMNNYNLEIPLIIKKIKTEKNYLEVIYVIEKETRIFVVEYEVII